MKTYASKRILLSLIVFTALISNVSKSEIRHSEKAVNHKEYQTQYLEHKIKVQIDSIRCTYKNTYVHEFVNSDFIFDILLYSDIAPSVVIAQSAIETAWGRKVIGNNYFGIKATNDNFILHRTVEYIDNERVMSFERFQAYQTKTDAIIKHSNLLTQSYSVESINTYDEVIVKLKKYATDPFYRRKLRMVIDKFNLSRYDDLKKSNIALLNILKS